MAAVRMRVVRACRGFSRSRRMTVIRIAEIQSVRKAAMVA